MKTLLFVILVGLSTQTSAMDVEQYLRKSGCFRCHSLDKQKYAPPFKKIAKEHASMMDNIAHIKKSLTTRPPIQVDGSDEDHVEIKVKDENELNEIVHWILNR